MLVSIGVDHSVSVLETRLKNGILKRTDGQKQLLLFKTKRDINA